jgi:hypothetical protein
LVRNQLAIYGIHHLGDEEIQKYAVEMLKDQEQVRQISSEVAMAKLKDVILEKATKKETAISHDEFLEELKNNLFYYKYLKTTVFGGFFIGNICIYLFNIPIFTKINFIYEKDHHSVFLCSAFFTSVAAQKTAAPAKTEAVKSKLTQKKLSINILKLWRKR